MLTRRAVLAIAVVVDIALHARTTAISAKALAERQNLPPRHLDGMLKALVQRGILKSNRGPRGGYELARERRRVTAGDIVRAALTMSENFDGEDAPTSFEAIVAPVVKRAAHAFLGELDSITVDSLCREVTAKAASSGVDSNFTI